MNLWETLLKAFGVKRKVPIKVEHGSEVKHKQLEFYALPRKMRFRVTARNYGNSVKLNGELIDMRGSNIAHYNEIILGPNDQANFDLNIEIND